MPNQHPNIISSKDLEKWFKENFGKEYNKMQKEVIARMVYNVSMNFVGMHNEYNKSKDMLEKGSKIWLAMVRQRDWHKSEHRRLRKAEKEKLGIP